MRIFAAFTSSLVVSFVLSSCAVGPNFERPDAPLEGNWRDAGTPHVSRSTEISARWWSVFGDPVLDRLIHMALLQNPSLQAAGLRVLQAQARRGIAIGNLFPQTQRAGAGYSHTRRSLNSGLPVLSRDLDNYRIGFDAAWEIDLWGRYRRAVESADETLLAAVADYDDVFVSLAGEVAATYAQIRIFDERIALARNNLKIQQDGLDIARVRFDAGGTSQLDVEQARALLEDTAASIPRLELQRRRSENSLAVLLGIPPRDLSDLLSDTRGIPVAPLAVSVEIPAEVLTHRPDVRAAEHRLAAQSAQIGVAKSQFFPSLQLTGSIGLTADKAERLFAGDSLEAVGGPSLSWPILNYGRILNAVRFEDARFQELVATYTSVVLQAQQEVEDALIGYLRGTEEVSHLERAVEAANRSVELAMVQYREGAADFTRVLTTQQSKLASDVQLVTTRGEVTLSVIALYKALGGGWEIRDDYDFIPESTKAVMRARTAWGDLLEAPQPAATVESEDGSVTPPPSVENPGTGMTQ